MTEIHLPTAGPFVGDVVRLDALGAPEADELHPVLTDASVYTDEYVMHRRPTSRADARALVRERFAAPTPPDGHGGGRITYVVRLVADGPLGAADTVVGTTALLEADDHHERIHLGATLYRRRWWGTAVNPEAKLLLLTHCFDECGYGRVKIQTDARNHRSQAAIARLGATREGVLRRDTQREDGTFRDTVVFSILRQEWPRVRTGLRERVAAHLQVGSERRAVDPSSPRADFER